MLSLVLGDPPLRNMAMPKVGHYCQIVGCLKFCSNSDSSCFPSVQMMKLQSHNVVQSVDSIVTSIFMDESLIFKVLLFSPDPRCDITDWTSKWRLSADSQPGQGISAKLQVSLKT